jgi:tungstate transport system substrate-binding protein
MRQVSLAATVILLLFSLAVYEWRAGERLLITTTTSLYETGLLQALADEYQRESGVKVHFIPLGTGQALEFARRGDADGVMVHAPSLEERFLLDNFGWGRKVFAYNFFYIVGPSSDPAGARGQDVLTALRKIAEAGRAGKVRWISRGDNSGTHLKELALWQLSGVEARGGWYIETGSGMSNTLRVASEMGAYTLTDMGTYLFLYERRQVKLEVMVGEDKNLLNVYSIMGVRKSRKREKVMDFARFLVSDRGQDLIAGFKKGLFSPAVPALCENSKLANWIREVGFIRFENELWECPPFCQA